MIKTIVMGNIGRDPEERTTSNGTTLLTFSVASNSRKGGQQVTTWVKITVFNPERFKGMIPYLKKGAGIIVSGELRTEEYTDREGQKRTSIEVIGDKLDFSPFGKPDSSGNVQTTSSFAQSAAPAAPQDAGLEFIGAGVASGTGQMATSEEENLPF